MKRLNEYTIDELRNLELILSIVGQINCELSELHGATKMKDLEIVKFWAEQVKEAKRDVEMENERLPFDYKPQV